MLEIIAQEISAHKLTLCTAESLTGGLLSGKITSISGSSQFFLGGLVCYTDQIKKRILGVSGEALTQFGAVSAEVAQEMSQKAQVLFSSEIAIATTCIAGPNGGTKATPIGTVFISLTAQQKTQVARFLFTGDREAIREQTIKNSLMMLFQHLKRSL